MGVALPQLQEALVAVVPQLQEALLAAAPQLHEALLVAALQAPSALSGASSIRAAGRGSGGTGGCERSWGFGKVNNGGAA